MSRVVEVRDGRTILVDASGATTAVVLRGVNIAIDDEAAAARYLHETLNGKWVYVENGEVYRSPDGLYINDAIRRRAWLGMTYLGELDLGMPSTRPRVSEKKPAAKEAAKKKAKPKVPRRKVRKRR